MILLTGAPLSNALDWGEECLSAPPLEAFRGRPLTQLNQDAKSSLPNLPAWRSLPLAVRHLPSGLSQAGGYLVHKIVEPSTVFTETSFLTTSDLSFIPDDSVAGWTHTSIVSGSSPNDALSQFYEHSFLLHDDLPALNVTALNSFDDSTLKLSSTTEQHAQDSPEAKAVRQRPYSSRLSTLRDIPNAAYLRSLEPQTITIDLVVGILQIPAARSIKTRMANRLVDLVELTVADDTRSGFGISIWLPQNSKPKPLKPLEHDLRSMVLKLRPRDIVLIKNLALTSFQNKVHGQSLRKANTTLDLLYRGMVASHDEPGAYSFRELASGDNNDTQLLRVKQVKEWMISFVGSGSTLPSDHRTSEKDPRAKARRLQQLPADTP